MTKDKLVLEIAKYSSRYKDELKRSGLSEEQARETLNKFVKEVYENYSANPDEAFRAFSFHNSLGTSKSETTLVKKLSIYRHK